MKITQGSIVQQISSLLAVFLLVAAGCGKKDVVARVGDETIGGEELREFIKGLPPGLRTTKSGLDAQKDYLQTLIDEKLLVMEAEAQGLDTTMAFLTVFEEAVRNKGIEEFHNRNVVPKVPMVSEAEAREEFTKDGMDRERYLTRIVLATETEAITTLGLIRKGAGFEEIARRVSIDTTGSKGVGFVNKEWALRVGIPELIFQSLPDNEVSEPLPVQGGYQLVRFTEERTADFEKMKNRLQNRLWRQRLLLKQREVAEELAVRFHLRLDAGGLAFLKERAQGLQRRFFPQLSETEGRRVLYHYDGGTITVGDFIGALRRIGTRPTYEDSTSVTQTAWVTIIPDAVFWEAARRQKVMEEPKMLWWRERKRTELLIHRLRQVTISGRITIDDEETKAFYTGHQHLFQKPETLWIQEILTETEEEAQNLRKRIERGEDITRLATAYTIRPHVREEGGKLHIHNYERPVYGEMLDEAQRAETGKLIGPVKVKEGFSVFKVLSKEGGGVEPFDSAKRRAMAIIREEKESRMFGALLDELRRKYANRVTIDEERLKRVAVAEETAGLNAK
jgi:parvulin-like peptidyl-prolyl isomerase